MLTWAMRVPSTGEHDTVAHAATRGSLKPAASKSAIAWGANGPPDSAWIVRRHWRGFDLRIELVCLHREDFENRYFTLVDEVKRHGR